MEKRIASPEELESEARAFLGKIAPHEGRAMLVTLSGELGAGKTAFTKAIVAALGVLETVTSPTFVLEKIYQLEGKPFMRLIHIDAYRLESGAELAPLGFDELMKDAGNLVLLEWPEKVSGGLPHADVRISLSVQSDGSRTISYDPAL